MSKITPTFVPNLKKMYPREVARNYPNHYIHINRHSRRSRVRRPGTIILVTMAKGNLILGTMSGKLGDIVAYTNNGKQCARVRRRVVKNPNSDGQQVQRMILSTAAQFASKLQPILNNGFEGIQKGAPSLAYARKQAMRMLRTEGMWNNTNGYNYNYKGSKYLAPNPYMISRGSLYQPTVTYDSAIFCVECATIDTTKTAAQIFPWLEPGMQITLIEAEMVGSAANPAGANSVVKFASFVPKFDNTPLFLNPAGDEATFVLNPAALDEQYNQGDVLSIDWSPNGGFNLPGLQGDPIMGAVIHSSRDGSRRSTSHIVVANDALGNWGLSPDVVVDSYADAGVDSGAPATYYLDQNNG